MAQLESILQKFKSWDDAPLTSLRCHVCPETRAQYILWTDIQKAFKDVTFLWINHDRVMFTIDSDGELWQPLRIAHNPDAAYIVISRQRPDLLAMGRHYIQQENNESPVIDVGTDNEPIQGVAEGQMNDELFSGLKEMLECCVSLHESLQHDYDDNSDRCTFLQTTANIRYYHSMVVDEIERLNQAGVRACVDGKDQEQLMEELRDVEKQVPEWDYLNVCWNTLYWTRYKWILVPFMLYIALPLDLHSCDDLDPSTHQFRLYFLCNNWVNLIVQEDLPDYVHLSNHPGYNIKRPQEFFQVYGDYSLRMLRMVKHGYSDYGYEIPSLETFKILWNCDTDIIGNHLTADTLGPLIDKAITYIQDLSLPKRIMQLIPTRQECCAIMTFLDMPDGDNGKSNLSRYIMSDQVVHWMCQPHVQQKINQSGMQDLIEFVHGHGGHVDMHHSTIKVELGSSSKADRFRTLLTGAKHIFDISIKLDWKATRSFAERLFLDIANTGTVALEIDGITLDINPQGHVQYHRNLFSDVIFRQTQLQFVTLLNYPRPQEQCIQFERFLLRSMLMPIQLAHQWIELREELHKFGDMVSTAKDPSDCITAIGELEAVLEKFGLVDVTMVTIYNGLWDAVCDLEKRTFVEVGSVDTTCPIAVLSSGSLRRLTMVFYDEDFDQRLFHMVQTNNTLQELNVYYRDVLHHSERIVEMWYNSSSSFRLTLLERMLDTQGRVLARLAIMRSDNKLHGNSTIDVPGSDANPPICQQQALDTPLGIQFLEWDCDHIRQKVSDNLALFLDMATQQHPSVLTSLMLDVSWLSHAGLVLVTNILRRSILDHFGIVCNPISPDLCESITSVLGSVPWLALKSLVLSGNNINEWLQLWPMSVAPQLLSVQIRGTGDIQELSHSSVLFVHHLYVESPLAEFHFENVQLQDKQDWMLVIDGMDPEFPRTLSLCCSSHRQFMSCMDAVDMNMFVSHFATIQQDQVFTRIASTSFSLDVVSPSRQSFERYQGILRVSEFEHLHVVCTPFDLDLCDAFAQMLHSISWFTLKTLSIIGDNIDGWMQHLPSVVDAPRLMSVSIHGTDSEASQLSHASVLNVQRLIQANPRTELKFENVKLQDTCDWVFIVERMDLSLLNADDLPECCESHLVSTSYAVDLFI